MNVGKKPHASRVLKGTMYPAQTQLDTRVRELIEEIAEVKLYLDALEEHGDCVDAEPPQLSC